MPSSKSPLRLSDSVSSRVSRALRKAASKRLSGFTLAELIVVITILAVLATIGLLALSGYREDAKDSVIKTNVRSVYAAIAAESTTLQKSARCFIRHSPTHTLTGGAIVMFDGGVADTLVWGDCGTPGTNYSAGNPDYAALRLDPEKFRISLLASPLFSSPLLAASALGWPGAPRASAGPAPGDEYVADPSLLLVGAADLADGSGSKPRVRTFVQVAAILSSETSYVAGDFPSSDVDDGAVAGLIKDAAYAGSSTGALVDGAPTGAPAPCEAGEVSGYSVPALSSGERQEVRKAVANGEGVAVARCSYGTVRIEDETAQCDTDYVPADPVPGCVRDNCGGTFPADAVSNELTPGGTGNWTYGETAGTCRFKCAENFTWSDGACKADCTVTAASPSYQSLSYGLVANLPIAHGATAAGTGTHVFGTNPANGELQVSFSYSCNEGVATPTPTEIGGSCVGAGYDWNSDFAAPACVLRTYAVSGSFGANAAGATVSVCGQDVTADASGNFSRTGIPHGTNCADVTATLTNYVCTTSINGPGSLAADVTEIGGNCYLSVYSVSGSFGANGSGATVTGCENKSTVADASGNFSFADVIHGTNCNNVIANRAGYSCSTTTDGPVSLTANVTNVAGSCASDFIFNRTITAHRANYNVKNEAIAAGWNQTDKLIATITINSGIVIGSTSPSTYSFDTGTGFPQWSTISLINNGTIAWIGWTQGTNPGGWPTAWWNGGPWLIARHPISITNAGTIAWGGGGGWAACGLANWWRGAWAGTSGLYSATWGGTVGAVCSDGSTSVTCTGGAWRWLGIAGSAGVSNPTCSFWMAWWAAGIAIAWNANITWISTWTRTWAIQQ